MRMNWLLVSGTVLCAFLNLSPSAHAKPVDIKEATMHLMTAGVPETDAGNIAMIAATTSPRGMMANGGMMGNDGMKLTPEMVTMYRNQLNTAHSAAPSDRVVTDVRTNFNTAARMMMKMGDRPETMMQPQGGASGQ
jgi:hypothetical protein